MRFWHYNQPKLSPDEGGGAAPSVPAEAVETPAATEIPVEAPADVKTPAQMLREYWTRDNAAVPIETSTVVPQEQPPSEQLPVEAPAEKKYADRYSSIPELEKGYKELQGTYTKDHQALLDAQKNLEAERTAKADLETKLQALSQPPKPADEDEFEGLDDEAYAQKFYEDPKGFTRKIEERALAKAEKVFSEKLAQIEGKLNPIIEKDEAQQHAQLWQEATKKLGEELKDIPEYVDGMRQYISENNLSGSKTPGKVLKDAYIYAKGLKAQEAIQASAKKIAEYEAKIQEYENKLKASKDETVKEYLTDVRNTQNQIPNTIAGHSNSGAPAMPPVSLKGKPMSEVHKAASAFLFGNR